jgi:hypothetical protein
MQGSFLVVLERPDGYKIDGPSLLRAKQHQSHTLYWELLQEIYDSAFALCTWVLIHTVTIQQGEEMVSMLCETK